MLTGGPTIVDRPRDVLFVLAPDVSAPSSHLAFRFPPLGPAIVAACIPALRFHAVDLALDAYRHPLECDLDVLAHDDAIERHLGVCRDERIDALMDLVGERLASRLEQCNLVAISVDRGSQIPFVAAFSCYLKQRFCKRIIVGGVAMHRLRDMLVRTNAEGADIVTTASTPDQIRRAFDMLVELPEHRRGAPIEPNEDAIVLVRGGMRKAPSPLDWPMPDFSIYDLRAYRRDAVLAQSPAATKYRGDIGDSLTLPYFFTFECQFSCAFCQTGGTQESKPISDVVRELAALSERWETREFLFFDAQINLHARALSQALVDARLDLRWSDSYRVRPSEPGDLELMARAGCASLTVGVESASDRVLKAMVKGHRAEHATETIRRAHQHEMLVRVNLLACFPGESREDLQATCDWVRDNAFAIDDVAPSSFYLTADSPLGRMPDRHGIRIRGPRQLVGEGKFRKSPESLAYDEIDGLAWEDREPMLEQAEDLLRNAWIEGKGLLGPLGGFSPSTMLALRRRFSTKAEIRAFVLHCHGMDTAHEDATRTPAPVASDENRPARHAVPDLQPEYTFRPVLLAPRNVRPAIVRAFVEGLRLAKQSETFRARDGDTLHAVVFADGGFLLFRGSVTRGPAGVLQTVIVEERMGDIVRMEPLDPRVSLCTKGASLDLLGREAREANGTPFEVLTFRVHVGSGPRGG